MASPRDNYRMYFEKLLHPAFMAVLADRHRTDVLSRYVIEDINPAGRSVFPSWREPAQAPVITMAKERTEAIFPQSLGDRLRTIFTREVLDSYSACLGSLISEIEGGPPAPDNDLFEVIRDPSSSAHSLRSRNVYGIPSKGGTHIAGLSYAWVDVYTRLWVEDSLVTGLQGLISSASDRRRRQMALEAAEASSEQYESQAHETKKFIKWIDGSTPQSILSVIRTHFRALFAMGEEEILNIQSTGSKASIPAGFAEGDRMDAFLENAATVAVRNYEAQYLLAPHTARSLRDLGDEWAQAELNRRVAECFQERWVRLRSDAGLKIALRNEEEQREVKLGRWFFFHSLLCAIGNALKHSSQLNHPDVSMGVDDTCGSVILWNLSSNEHSGEGCDMDRGPRIGSTEKAIRFFVKCWRGDADGVSILPVRDVSEVQLQHHPYANDDWGPSFWQTRIPIPQALLLRTTICR